MILLFDFDTFCPSRERRSTVSVSQRYLSTQRPRLFRSRVSWTWYTHGSSLQNGDAYAATHHDIAKQYIVTRKLSFKLFRESLREVYSH